MYCPLGEMYVSLWPTREGRSAARKSSPVAADQAAPPGEDSENRKADPAAARVMPLAVAPEPDSQDPVASALASIRASRPPMWLLVEAADREGRLEELRSGTHPALAALGMGQEAMVRRFLGETPRAAGKERERGPEVAEDEHDELGRSERADDGNGQGSRGEVKSRPRKPAKRKPPPAANGDDKMRQDMPAKRARVEADQDESEESDGDFFAAG